jgi:2TM domain-containing protein
MTNDLTTPEQAARDQAVQRLKKQRDFRGHLLAYLLVNTLLVVIWATTSHGFFWPAFVIVPWGLGVAANAWDVYGRQRLPEEAIQHEMERHTRRG